MSCNCNKTNIKNFSSDFENSKSNSRGELRSFRRARRNNAGCEDHMVRNTERRVVEFDNVPTRVYCNSGQIYCLSSNSVCSNGCCNNISGSYGNGNCSCGSLNGNSPNGCCNNISGSCGNGNYSCGSANGNSSRGCCNNTSGSCGNGNCSCGSLNGNSSNGCCNNISSSYGNGNCSCGSLNGNSSNGCCNNISGSCGNGNCSCGNARIGNSCGNGSCEVCEGETFNPVGIPFWVGGYYNKGCNCCNKTEKIPDDEM